MTFTANRRLRRSLWTFTGSYSYQKIGVSDIASGYEGYALSQFIGSTPDNKPTDALKGIIRSEITPMLSYNSTDAYFNPTRGTNVQMAVGISGGFMGGDFSMIRPTIVLRHFFPDRWLSGGRNVFGFNVQGEYIQAYNNSSVPFFDRFYIGGENSIRGFDIRSISPLAISKTPLFDLLGNPIIDQQTGLPKISESMVPVGGDTVGIFNFEYRIPIAGPLSLAAFYDMGINRVSRKIPGSSLGVGSIDVIGSTNNVIRSSTGMEIQFVLPVVSAPFRLIFAYNPQRLSEDVRFNNFTYRLRDPRKDIKFTVGRSF